MNHKLGKKHEGESASGGYDWSCIPVGILDIIVEKLEHFRDRLSLAAVCKDWRIPVTPRPLPWVVALSRRCVFVGTSRSVTLTFEFHEICCDVNEPCNRRPYKRSLEMATCADRFLVEPKPKGPAVGRFLRELLPPDTHFSDDHFIVHPRIGESKLGWLVVSMSYYRLIGEDCQQVWNSLFVYHPFSARSMSLPDLHIENIYACTITFSGSDPTSPECVFFVVDWHGNDLSIHTWSPGQEAWKERHVIVKDQYWHEVRSLIWLDGIFYWGNRKHMESFNLSNGERKEIALPSQLAGIDILDHATKLFELNGEILLLVYDSKHSKRSELFFKFNPFEGSWIRRDDFLNDRLLFISRASPSCYSVLGSGDTSFSRVFINHALCNHCEDVVDMDENTAVECAIVDCLAYTDYGFELSEVEWLAPPLKTFG